MLIRTNKNMCELIKECRGNIEIKLNDNGRENVNRLTKYVREK